MELNRAKKLLIVGHSHVKRLRKYIKEHPEHYNFGLPRHKIEIEMWGFGGLLLEDFNKPTQRGRAIFDYIEKFKPEVILLMIGCNDVTSLDYSVFMHSYLKLMEELKKRFIGTKIVITQLLPRYGRRAADGYNNKASRINRSLLSVAKRDEFIWMKFVKMYFPMEDHTQYVAMRKCF